MSQELVKLAKDKGSSDNITIVVVFLKPIEELAAMELPIDTKDFDTRLFNCRIHILLKK